MTCAARQGHPSDCTPYLGRGMRCPDCPRDHYEEAADIVRGSTAELHPDPLAQRVERDGNDRERLAETLRWMLLMRAWSYARHRSRPDDDMARSACIAMALALLL